MAAISLGKFTVQVPHKIIPMASCQALDPWRHLEPETSVSPQQRRGQCLDRILPSFFMLKGMSPSNFEIACRSLIYQQPSLLSIFVNLGSRSPSRTFPEVGNSKVSIAQVQITDNWRAWVGSYYAARPSMSNMPWLRANVIM